MNETDFKSCTWVHHFYQLKIESYKITTGMIPVLTVALKASKEVDRYRLKMNAHTMPGDYQLKHACLPLERNPLAHILVAIGTVGWGGVGV